LREREEQAAFAAMMAEKAQKQIEEREIYLKQQQQREEEERRVQIELERKAQEAAAAKAKSAAYRQTLPVITAASIKSNDFVKTTREGLTMPVTASPSATITPLKAAVSIIPCGIIYS
jgi:hypothetical protein